MIRNGKESERKKILAINFGGIGDEILFLPTLQTIRNYAPNSSITLLLEPRSRSVAELTNLVDSVITFDIKKRPLSVGDLVDLLALIKEGGYDCVVSSGGSPLVSALLFLSGIPERIGYHSNRLAPVLLTQPVPLDKKQYAAAMYHDLAIGFLKQKRLTPPAVSGEKINDSLIPTVSVKPDSMDRMQNFIAERGLNRERRSAQSRLILVHPGTSRLATEKGIFKTWPTDSWLDLLFLIGRENENKPEADRDIVILAGGPDDKEIIEDILNKAGDQLPHMVSAYGQTKSLADLAALIKLCDIMLCVDSAPMHVAIGLRKPIVALFGPFNPALLVPNDSRFKTIWDSRGGTRSMLDRLGVNIPPQDVFQALIEAKAAVSAG
ncbi:glycosyltransferase family 9 protein [Candidatus Obscuribacterales bacterium]|nr:glycosyltransferase family 9 protein [Candidatus Obscuribacterales bacterium]MBX3150639.1 glycosyltransferase family 9 protein [Candidatus Obscuribacterales bacterium]